MPITIEPISDDCGFAVVMNDDSELRVDVFPPDDEGGAFISITEPRLTALRARQFAQLLLVAADFADQLEAEYAKSAPKRYFRFGFGCRQTQFVDKPVCLCPKDGIYPGCPVHRRGLR